MRQPAARPSTATLLRAPLLGALLCASLLATAPTTADARGRRATASVATFANDGAAAPVYRARRARLPRAQRSGSGETPAERDRRLMRECRGLPNAGACAGFGS